MKIIVKSCTGKTIINYNDIKSKHYALRLAQLVVIDIITQGGEEDGIYVMSWKRTFGGYNIYDNFGGGLCYTIRIKK